ncbi:hypothetical protein SAMN05428953_12669 [Mesorhizobium muleiense]|uniref:Uncharacterized protein n=1 Tax=Mesorhizobium muleiense TaxID=1004279 RepID=A0A1G9H4N7_9HYPH|nr:hypothetical protein [Mesorhizobium muleiense]SDL07968.1 hypothetical protein SAMN05428953_12669 [Mesorhizobium muleiense]
MKPNKIAAAARKKIAGKPELEHDMRDKWVEVQAKIDAHVAASKKKWKNYEASHLFYAARLAMLTAFVDGKTPQECAAAALEGID